MQTYIPDEIGLGLRAADKDPNGHLWYLALSGLRRGEIAGAKWSDIDFEAGTITVAPNRFQVGAATVVENEPKTQSLRRTLPLDERLISVLKRACPVRAGEAGAGRGARRQWLYRGERGRRTVHTGSADDMRHRLTTAAGVRPIRLHDARHSCGTALHLRGVPMAVIAKWLGHADASITARIYAHSQDDALRAASATLGQVVTPGG